jgi:septum site-determining protein MinC
MRLRGTRGGVLLTLDASVPLPEVAGTLAPHVALLAGNVAIEVAEKVPYEVVVAVAAGVAAAGGTVTDVRPPTTVMQVRGETVIVARTVRSGGRIVSNGALVVMGDVNPGAELVADGDVIVTGVLRGVAHAGAGGNERAVIYADRILAPQLRIAGALALGDPNAGDDERRTPEVALLQGDQIVVRPWSS